MDEKIKSFLADTRGYGRGSGDDDGYGDGCGDGDGDGCGRGSGDGDGYGYGRGYGDGDGDGDGCGEGYGEGYGYGRGSGDGEGYGEGYGYGCGYGEGYGYGEGDGYGRGYGDLLSITKVGEDNIYNIDEVQTVIDSVKGNIAKGRVLNDDMTFTPYWIVRIGNSFAHGETLHDAQRDAQAKYMRDASDEERLNMFVEQFPSIDMTVPAKTLFDWHNILTGSCLMGRTQWCQQHEIDIEKDTFTVRRFIELTKDSYGGNTIKQLLKLYNNDNFSE